MVTPVTVGSCCGARWCSPRSLEGLLGSGVEEEGGPEHWPILFDSSTVVAVMSCCHGDVDVPVCLQVWRVQGGVPRHLQTGLLLLPSLPPLQEVPGERPPGLTPPPPHLDPHGVGLNQVCPTWADPTRGRNAQPGSLGVERSRMISDQLFISYMGNLKCTSEDWEQFGSRAAVHVKSSPRHPHATRRLRYV